MSGNSKMFNVFAVYAVKCRKREEPSEKQQIIKFQLCEIIFLKIGHNYSGNGNAIATLNYLTQTTKMRFHKMWNKTKKNVCVCWEHPPLSIDLFFFINWIFEVGFIVRCRASAFHSKLFMFLSGGPSNLMKSFLNFMWPTKTVVLVPFTTIANN